MSNKPKYSFNSAIEDKLKNFKTHLQKQHRNENTIRQLTNYTGYYLNWLESENLQLRDARYNDILNFIDYCREVGKSKRHINRILAAIREYYKFKKETEPNLINPALNLYLKGIKQKLPANLIDFKELEKLYDNYPTTTNRDKRNKIILGLLIYQGVTTEELKQLEPNHLKLKEGKIYVPGNRRRNSRTLELKSCQILELNEYINEVRPTILQEIQKPKPARKPNKIDKAQLDNQLLISINGSENIKNSLLHMFKAIQKQNPEILHAKQIRASVITYWLKNYNLRQVQYMAGHKYVSSTERYQLNNLDSLQEKIEQCHPLN